MDATQICAVVFVNRTSDAFNGSQRETYGDLGARVLSIGRQLFGKQFPIFRWKLNRPSTHGINAKKII